MFFLDNLWTIFLFYVSLHFDSLLCHVRFVWFLYHIFWPHRIPSNFLNFWLIVRLVILCILHIRLFFKRKKKCILSISRVCSCLDRLRLRQKDSNLIFAWNTFYRLFIIVLRYVSSFATVDVNLTHSY